MQFPILFTYWRQYCSLWRLHWRTCHFIKTAWLSVVYSTVRVCEHWRWTFWTPFVTVITLQTVLILDLTLIVSFCKIEFLLCRWKQIIISRSWNWTHLQFSTQCSNGCQCVLCNFQWFLFSIVSVTVLYTGGCFYRDTLYNGVVEYLLHKFGKSNFEFIFGWFHFFAPVMLCISVSCAVVRCLVCLYVCLSRSWVVSKWINIKIFSPLGSHAILVFPCRTA